jgi:hypothetical protein
MAGMVAAKAKRNTGKSKYGTYRRIVNSRFRRGKDIPLELFIVVGFTLLQTGLYYTTKLLAI